MQKKNIIYSNPHINDNVISNHLFHIFITLYTRLFIKKITKHIFICNNKLLTKNIGGKL